MRINKEINSNLLLQWRHKEEVHDVCKIFSVKINYSFIFDTSVNSNHSTRLPVWHNVLLAFYRLHCQGLTMFRRM